MCILHHDLSCPLRTINPLTTRISVLSIALSLFPSPFNLVYSLYQFHNPDTHRSGKLPIAINFQARPTCTPRYEWGENLRGFRIRPQQWYISLLCLICWCWTLTGQVVVVNLPSRAYDERLTYTDEYDVQPLEFITVTGASTDRPDRNVSRIVRSQAMRNYVWRQNHPTLTDEMAAAAAVPLKEKPQRKFEGKFRVGSRSRKKRTSAKAKRSIVGSKTGNRDLVLEAQTRWLIRQSLMPDKSLLMRGGSYADPFDAFAFPLGPESEKFIFYCECSAKYFHSHFISLLQWSRC